VISPVSGLLERESRIADELFPYTSVHFLPLLPTLATPQLVKVRSSALLLTHPYRCSVNADQALLGLIAPEP